jgi:hypothetical protein
LGLLEEYPAQDSPGVGVNGRYALSESDGGDCPCGVSSYPGEFLPFFPRLGDFMDQLLGCLVEHSGAPVIPKPCPHLKHFI